jgi:hypothetical protein
MLPHLQIRDRCWASERPLGGTLPLAAQETVAQHQDRVAAVQPGTGGQVLGELRRVLPVAAGVRSAWA